MSLNFLRLIVLSLFIMLLAPITKADFTRPLTFSPTGVCPTANNSDYVGSLASCNACVSEFNTNGGHNLSCNGIAQVNVSSVAYDCGGTFSGGGDCTGNLSPETTNPCPDVGGILSSGIDINAETCLYPGVDPDGNGDQCSSTAGDVQRDLIGASPVSFVCISGCRYENSNPAGGMTVTSTNAFTNSSTVTYIGTGDSCDNSEGTNQPPNNPNVTDSDNDGIPEIDGNELPEVPPPSDGCTILPDGSLYCGSSASSPPAPDDGTPGQPATPDQTVTDNSTNTTNNYYDDTTTGNSSSGTPDGQVDGVCDPAVENCGTDQGSAEDNGCGSLPTCTGDAIQCVILKMQHDTRCNLQTEIDDVTETDVMSQIGVTETIEDWKVANDADPDNNIDVDTEFFNDTPGNEACPADFSVSVPFMATPVVIPNQPICDFLDYLRPAVIALSYLVAGLMLFAAFREGI